MREYTIAMRAVRLSYVPTSPRVAPLMQQLQDANEAYFPCSVCGVDGAWPHILQSDATRAVSMDCCRVCGGVVCAFCGPIGGTLPGDGLEATFKLPDFRLSLPSIGLLQPQTVCRVCFMNSFKVT
jgi:hypothetical protein